MSIVRMAKEILDMHDEMIWQAEEICRLREIEAKYNSLLNESFAHSTTMMGNTLKLLLTPGVVEACHANATFSEEAA